MSSEKENSPPINGANGDHTDSRGSPKSSGTRNSSGWDGKLRIEKNLVLANPEALSDPEYSDEENVAPGELIDADEGKLLFITPAWRVHRGVC
jgi:protein phosphatase 1 regulatory subunit 7